jgi:hypothetical protein
MIKIPTDIYFVSRRIVNYLHQAHHICVSTPLHNRNLPLDTPEGVVVLCDASPKQVIFVALCNFLDCLDCL